MQRRNLLITLIFFFSVVTYTAVAGIKDSHYQFTSTNIKLEISGNDSFFAGPDSLYMVSNSRVSRFNGTSFELISKIPQAFETNLVSVTYGNGIFLASNSNELFVSKDAIQWAKNFSFPVDLRANPISRIVYQNGLFLALGSSNIQEMSLRVPVYKSEDGINWQASEVKVSLVKKDEINYFNLITYSDGVFLLVGNKLSARSVDFKTWTTTGIGQTINPEAGTQKTSLAVSGSKVLVTTSSLPVYWISENLGSSWEELKSPDLSFLSNVIFEKKNFVMVSSNFQRDGSYSYSSTTGRIGDWKSSRMPIASDNWSEIYSTQAGEYLFVLQKDNMQNQTILIGKPKTESEIADENRQTAEAKAKAESEAKALAEAQARARKAQDEAKAKTSISRITCVKGKVVKKIAGTNPKCPKGYKKK